MHPEVPSSPTPPAAESPPQRGRWAIWGVLGAHLVGWLLFVRRLPGPIEGIQAEAIHWFSVARASALGLDPMDLLVIDQAYPPLYYLLAALAATGGSFLGFSEANAPARALLALPNLVLGGILIAGVASFLLRRGRPLGGALAAVGLAVPLFPWAIAATPEMSVVAGAAGFAVACGLYVRRPGLGSAVLLATATAAALLSKQTTVIYFVAPAVWLGWRLRWRARELLPAIAGGVVGAALAWALFYGRLPLDPLADVLGRATLGETAVDPRARLSNATFYLRISVLFAGPGLIGLLAGLFVPSRVRTAADRQLEIWLLAAVVLPLAVLSVFPIKQDTYLLPLLPALAALCVVRVDRLPQTARRVVTALVLAGWGAGLLFGFAPIAREIVSAGAQEDAIFHEAAAALEAECGPCQVPALINHRGLATRLLHLRLVEQADAEYLPDSHHVARTGAFEADGGPPGTRDATLVLVVRSKGADPAVCLSPEELATWTSRPDLGPAPGPVAAHLARTAVASGRIVGSWGVGGGLGQWAPGGLTLCRLGVRPSP